MKNNAIVHTKPNSSVTLMRLKNDAVNLDILHLGKISSVLNSYFLKNSIKYNNVDSILEKNEIDIILVNNDSGSNDYLSKVINNINLIIYYSKANYTKSGIEFVNSSIVPVILNYFLKIKGNINHSSKEKVQDVSNVFLNKVTAIIDQHLDDHSLNIEKLSELMCMSRSALSKKIKNHTGLKPTQYISHYKLEKSKHLLIMTDWQISKISDALGFSSQQYYCRLFKDLEGTNPSKYRLQKTFQFKK